MATKVKVDLSKGTGEWCNVEISGNTNYPYDNGSHEFTIGQQEGSYNIFMMRIYKKTPGTVKITAVDGTCLVSIDRAKDKTLAKGKSITMSGKANGALVREKP